MTDIQDDIADLALLPAKLNLQFPAAAPFVRHISMSPEPKLIWTLGNRAQMQVRVVPGASIGFEFTVRAFAPPQQPVQGARVYIDDQQVGDWMFDREGPCIKLALVPKELVPPSGVITLQFEVANAAAPASLGLSKDQRVLGIGFFEARWQQVIDAAAFLNKPYGRRVGTESRRTFDLKVRDGFWDRFIVGQNVLDIGFQGYEGGAETIAPGAIGVDVNYPGYDGRTLPFADESQDAVYSSHCLEHIADYIQAIQDWYRVTRYGGHIIVVVPHAHLYERRKRPPLRSRDHKRAYTPTSLVSEFDQALAPNSYRIRHLVENDWLYNYSLPATVHPSGCYEIEIVIEKIRVPNWTVPD